VNRENKSAGESRIAFNPTQCGGRPCIRGIPPRLFHRFLAALLFPTVAEFL
jgi:hypothetical protein